MTCPPLLNHPFWKTALTTASDSFRFQFTDHVKIQDGLCYKNLKNLVAAICVMDYLTRATMK